MSRRHISSPIKQNRTNRSTDSQTISQQTQVPITRNGETRDTSILDTQPLVQTIQDAILRIFVQPRGIIGRHIVDGQRVERVRTIQRSGQL